MPVKKSMCHEAFLNKMQCCCASYARKIFVTLFAILLVYIIIWMATLIRNNLQKYNYIGRADRQERSFTVSASEKITATPDVAITTIGMVTTAPTVAEAQQKNSEVMNSLVSKLKAMGIEEKDLQTQNYNIYPSYDYTENSGRELLGYEVNQQLRIKIRDLDKAKNVIALAGEVGANTVSGLQFTIDDTEKYIEQVREKAMAKARTKAAGMAEALGVKVVDVISYNEYQGGMNDYSAYKSYSESGLGGAVPAPSIESGSMELELTVQVTYEIL